MAAFDYSMIGLDIKEKRLITNGIIKHSKGKIYSFHKYPDKNDNLKLLSDSERASLYEINLDNKRYLFLSGYIGHEDDGKMFMKLLKECKEERALALLQKLLKT